MKSKKNSDKKFHHARLLILLAYHLDKRPFYQSENRMNSSILPFKISVRKMGIVTKKMMASKIFCYSR